MVHLMTNTLTEMPDLIAPEILVVKRPFLEFKEGDRITAKDIGPRADVDFLHGNGTVTPLLGKVKGARPTYASLLDEIEEQSNLIVSLRDLHETAVRDRGAEVIAVEGAWQKRYDEMYESLLQDMRTLTAERNELRRQLAVVPPGTTVAHATSEPEPDAVPPGGLVCDPTGKPYPPSGQPPVPEPAPVRQTGRKPPPNQPQAQPMRTGGAKLDTATPKGAEASGII